MVLGPIDYTHGRGFQSKTLGGTPASFKSSRWTEPDGAGHPRTELGNVRGLLECPLPGALANFARSMYRNDAG